MAEKGNPPEIKNTTKPAKPEEKAKKKEKDVAHAPLLVEFTITTSVIILVVVFFTIVAISVLTGATLLDFVVRTSISILVIGILLLLIVRQISSGMSNSEAAVKESKKSSNENETQTPDPAEAK